MTLIEQLNQAPEELAVVLEPGEITLSELRLSWTDEALVLKRSDAEPLRLAEGEVAMQLSRSERAVKRNWLQRLVRRVEQVEHWLHAELRMRGRERVRLSARVDDPWLLDGLLVLEHPGEEISEAVLLEVLRAVRARGGRVLEVEHRGPGALDMAEHFAASLGIELPRGTGEAIEVRSSQELLDALKRTPDDGVIRLPAGRFELLKAIHVRGPLTIAGEGPEVTRVFIRRSAGALTIDEGVVCLRDMSITGGAISSTTLVQIRGGAGVLERCRIASADELGLGVEQGCVAYLKGCELSRNLRTGLRIAEAARVVVHDSSFLRERSAIESEDGSDLVLYECAIRNSDQALRGRGKVRVEGSSFVGNRIGVWLSGPSTEGRVLRSSFTDHTRAVVIEQQATVIAQENMCLEGEVGIDVRDATATLEDNACRGNSLAGIRGEQGSIALRSNDCTSNDIGIRLENVTLQALSQNTCGQNRVGLVLEACRSFVARGNLCNENREEGVRVVNGGGRLEGGTASHNRRGIVATGQAVLEIAGNSCHHNAREGIRIEDLAGGSVTSNDCGENHTGIGVDTDRAAAGLNIEDNLCVLNRVGLALEGFTEALVYHNQLQENVVRAVKVGPRAKPVRQDMGE